MNSNILLDILLAVPPKSIVVGIGDTFILDTGADERHLLRMHGYALRNHGFDDNYLVFEMVKKPSEAILIPISAMTKSPLSKWRDLFPLAWWYEFRMPNLADRALPPACSLKGRRLRILDLEAMDAMDAMEARRALDAAEAGSSETEAA